MKTACALFLLALVCSVSACSDDAPKAGATSDNQSTQLRDAVQKPITATNQAVDQAQATQERLDAAMNQIDSGGAQDQESEEE